MSSIQDIKYHLVFCTKYRYKLIDSDKSLCLRNYFNKNQKKWQINVLSLAIERDHVHILLSCKQNINLEKLIKQIKGGSSFLLRKQFNDLMVYSNLWTPSHFIGTIGNVSDSTIKDYIDNQGIEEKEVINRTFCFKVLKLNKNKKNNIDKWFSNIKFRPKALQQTAKVYDPKNENLNQIPIRNDLIKIVKTKNKQCKLWLRLPGGNGNKQKWIGLKGRELPNNIKFGDSKLIKRKGGYWVHLVVKEEVIIKNNFNNKKIRSIDLGISQPITSVLNNEGKIVDVLYLGKEIKYITHKRNKKATRLQENKANNIGKKLLKLSRSKNDYVHKYTKNIIELCKKEDSILVIGNIRGITKTWDKNKRKRNRTFRKKAKPTPYGKIMSQLWYKGTITGIQVIFQNEAYTSKRCSRCGEMGQRKGQMFICDCGYKNQADVNGAINIGLAYQLGLNGQSLAPAILAGNSL